MHSIHTGLSDFWKQALSKLRHAFQPIALFADGSVWGHEALLRGFEDAGFASIGEVFDRAFEERTLYALDLELRDKAFRSFVTSGLGQSKLFYNLDNRLLDMPDYSTSNTFAIASSAGLPAANIVFEISEIHAPGEQDSFDRVLASYRKQGFKLALDDFGTGFAGLKLLHRAQPDIVKIDRYFVAGSAQDPRKAAFLEKIVAMAHLMGISVIAEGVENRAELLHCSEAGCDMAQGFLLDRPQVDVGKLKKAYPSIVVSEQKERRRSSLGGRVEADVVVSVDPIVFGEQLEKILSRFRNSPGLSLLPVVDSEGRPLGAYRERDFREYVYSPFGIAVLSHLSLGQGAGTLLVRTPQAPLGTALARVVELYGASPESGGIVMTRRGKYAGLLPARELLSLVAERELAEARDQNPLTRLPGNVRIAEYSQDRLSFRGTGLAFCYFDFDHFKPFNDYYGFRSGDRVIMLFADILRQAMQARKGFAGHLGGDDFFASFDAREADEAIEAGAAVARDFSAQASSFYAKEDRARGWIESLDRDGLDRRFPLLTVSVALVWLDGKVRLDTEGLSNLLGKLKHEAKASPTHLAWKELRGSESSTPAPTPRASLLSVFAPALTAAT